MSRRYARRGALASLASTVLVIAGSAARLAAQDAYPRAVVLVTIDTLRADAVSLEDPRGSHTPFLAQLARQGVTFTHAYAPSSWTPPTMASIFTSLSPVSHGVRYGILGLNTVTMQPMLSPKLTTLAETIHGLGWKTIGVPSNLHLGARLGFNQGFDKYDAGDAFLNADQVNARAQALFSDVYSDPATVDGLFLWLHYFDPHDPYTAHRPFITRLDPSFTDNPSYYSHAVRNELTKRIPRFTPDVTSCLWPLYLSEAAFVDQRLRNLLRQLDLVDENVMIVVTADHGEELGDHGSIGHGFTLYEEVVRVPLIVRWPAGLPHGIRVDTPVSTLDIFPTIVDLMGIEPPAGVEGRSLAPSMKDRTEPEPRPVFFSLFSPQPEIYGVRDGGFKLIADRNRGKPSMLFDLSKDPYELHDVAADNRRVVERLEDLIDAWDAKLPRLEAPRATVDEELEEKMKSLGYLGH
ncbi:MAG: sulfatase [Acidobacteriota bacterium]